MEGRVFDVLRVVDHGGIQDQFGLIVWAEVNPVARKPGPALFEVRQTESDAAGSAGQVDTESCLPCLVRDLERGRTGERKPRNSGDRHQDRAFDGFDQELARFQHSAKGAVRLLLTVLDPYASADLLAVECFHVGDRGCFLHLIEECHHLTDLYPLGQGEDVQRAKHGPGNPLRQDPFRGGFHLTGANHEGASVFEDRHVVGGRPEVGLVGWRGGGDRGDRQDDEEDD